MKKFQQIFSYIDLKIYEKFSIIEFQLTTLKNRQTKINKKKSKKDALIILSIFAVFKRNGL